MASYKVLEPAKNGKPRIKITVELGYDDFGKRIRKFKTVTLNSLSDRTINKAIRDFEIEVSNMEIENNVENITFEQFVKRWMENYVEVDLSPNTLSTYRSIINSKTFEQFNKMKLAKIKKIHIVNYFVNEKKAGNKSLSSKFATLKSIFSKAINWEIIKENPMRGIKAPYVEPKQKELHFYDESQLTKMMDEIKKLKLKYRVMYKLAALVGLRESEIVAIRLEKINFTNNTILIDQAMKYDKKKGGSKLILGPTKNKQPRTVNVPIGLMNEIKLQVNEQRKLKIKSGAAWSPMLENEKPIDFLFTNSSGYPHVPSVLSDSWTRHRNQLGLPKLNFHALRHSCASYMVSKGVNFKIIQEQLGHKNIKETIDTYSHLTEKDKTEAIELFNNIL